MDHDIQFGELEQTEPVRRLRPDQNGQFRIVDYGSVGDDRIRVYVDLDVMRDIETHATSDTRVELGGVLLGGQFEDLDGKPFVVISESIRAEHYEATKGSFKFTHDTWAQITKLRGEFPPDLQMVGWYHTHPDWGVFLSGMDMFICDNFFNKPLDVALVVDPCRRDRGMFIWTEEPDDPIRRTSSFAIFASRHRQPELEQFVMELEEPLMTSRPQRIGEPYGAKTTPTFVQVDGNSTNSTVVLGMLTLQFCLLALLAWKLLLSDKVANRNVPSGDHETRLAKLEVDRRRTEVEAQKQLLEKLVERWDGTPKPFVDTLQEAQTEAEELKTHLAAHRSRERELEQASKDADAELSRLRDKNESQSLSLERLSTQVAELKNKVTEHQATIATLRGEKNDDAESTDFPWYRRPWFWGVVLLVGLVSAVGYVAVQTPRSRSDGL